MKYIVKKPDFTWSLLHPKYWKVWFGFGLLALIVNLLPYAVLYKLGRALGKISMRFAGKRRHIVQRNLELAFPKQTEQEREAFVLENFKNSGLALIETGITWFWPTWRFKRIIVAKELDAVYQHAENKKGVLLCCAHAMNLEITARAFAVLGLQGFGTYRPHSNPAYEFIQYRGRSHNGNQLIDRKDLKRMIKVMKEGERLWYLPDQDYGHNKSVFVPFFAVKEACTTIGTSILANSGDAAIMIGSGFRNEQGRYELIVNYSIEDEYPRDDDVAAAALMNQYLEKVIMRAPEQWLWMHRRYKSMPDKSQNNSRYK